MLADKDANIFKPGTVRTLVFLQHFTKGRYGWQMLGKAARNADH